MTGTSAGGGRGRLVDPERSATPDRTGRRGVALVAGGVVLLTAATGTCRYGACCGEEGP